MAKRQDMKSANYYRKTMIELIDLRTLNRETPIK